MYALYKTSEASEASANDIEIQVYPNPARDQITISFKGTESTPDWIIIHDLNGKMMWKSNWVEEASEQTINTFTFEAGIYFVAIGTGNQTLHHQKLIIVR